MEQMKSFGIMTFVLVLFGVFGQTVGRTSGFVGAAAIKPVEAGGGPTNTLGLPISDTSNTGVWTTEPLWSKLNERTSSDGANQILADGSPIATETFVVRITALIDNGLSTGHVIRVRWAKTATAGANYDIAVELRQGYVDETTLGTLIGTLNDGPVSGTTLAEATYTLTGTEADSITDYTSLYLRVWCVKNGGGANRNCQVDDVEFEVP